ncbi:hypothetical protein [Pseudomonas putida]|uniref:Uncharacterized protein n=1 Tax=Pseudomonas putida TaxID=303 RepID=A0A8I1JJR0_PSEPU|nr:hypothetical protein [Pseudomonas putida]MBI6882655.1 hypothetical protein [Pseudomonas putida]
MAIPLVHEDDMDMSFQEAFHVAHLIEECFFCKVPTRFWHHKSNQPVCPACSPMHTVKELPRFQGKCTEPTPKPLTSAQIQLRAQNDSIQAQINAALKRIHLLTNEKRTLHKKMVEANMTIKNPIE